MTPLREVEWLRKPFEGVIAMRARCFEPEVDTADTLRGDDKASESTFRVVTRNCERDSGGSWSDGGAFERGHTAVRPASSLAIIELELAPALQATVAATVFAAGEALGRFGESTSKESS